MTEVRGDSSDRNTLELDAEMQLAQLYGEGGYQPLITDLIAEHGETNPGSTIFDHAIDDLAVYAEQVHGGGVSITAGRSRIAIQNQAWSYRVLLPGYGPFDETHLFIAGSDEGRAVRSVYRCGGMFFTGPVQLVDAERYVAAVGSAYEDMLKVIQPKEI